MPISRFSLVLLAAAMAACSAGPRPDTTEKSTTPVVQPEGMPVLEAAQVAAAEPDVTPSTAPPKVAVEKPLAPVPAPQPALAPEPVAEAVVQPRTPARVEPRASPAAMKPTTPKATSTPESETSTEMDSPVEVSATAISGQITLAAGSGQTIVGGEISQAAVYFVPDLGSPAIKPGRFQIYTHNKEFEPASMVIPLGSTITFPNQDEILHNVFSVTPQSSFDLGIYGEGKSAEYTFKRAGLVLINCNVHHAMQANVLVVDTPYFTTPDANGRFKLAGLPGGRGKLMVWHPRASVKETVIEVPSSTPVALNLTLTKPSVTKHLNKDRKAY